MRRDFALPGTRARYARDRTHDVQHIKLVLDIDIEGERVSGRCSLTLRALAPDACHVRLDAVELDIARVSCADVTLPFTHDGVHLVVDLRQSPALADAAEAAPMVLDIDYTAAPRRGLHFVGPDDGHPDKPLQVWSQNQDEAARYWFPCFDSPHQKSSSEIVVTVPGNFTTLSNGQLVADSAGGSPAGARRTMHWRFDRPHASYLITLVAGEFSVFGETWRAPDGRDVELSCYVTPGREDDARRTVAHTAEMLGCFSRLFGVVYPYDKYAQVFVSDFIFGGMENTTATTLTDVVLVDKRAELDYAADTLVAHELAHQWFGDLLTCHEWDQGWLNEGFATYSEYLWREHHEGRDEADAELAAWGEAYFEEDANRYRRPVATRIYDEPLEIFDRHLYEKGGRILHMLRSVLGDEAFFATLGHYLRKHRDGSVHTRDLIVAIEEVRGRSLGWFFEQWVTEGSGHPELGVHYTWNESRSLALVTVEQRQEVDAQTPVFRLPVTIRFRVPGARDETDETGETGEARAMDMDVAIEVQEARQTFHITLPGRPSQVIFDPGKGLLAKVETDKSAALWRAELAGATLAADRAHAADELGAIGDGKATDALCRALQDDPFWSVRAHAAAALAEVRTTRARDALLGALSTTWHAKARRAIVTALGSWRDDERVAEALIDIIEHGDASYFVEAEACFALGKIRSARAPEVLRSALERDSFMDIIRQKAYLGLAEARDESALGLLAEATAYGRNTFGRRAALMALASLTAGRRDREAREARELAERLLADTELRVRHGAVESLHSIADAAAIPALERFIRRSHDGWLRRRAREVVRDLRAGLRSQARVDSLEGEVERLKKSLAELHARLERMEEDTAQNRTSRKSSQQQQDQKKQDEQQQKDQKKKKKKKKKKKDKKKRERARAGIGGDRDDGAKAAPDDHSGDGPSG